MNILDNYILGIEEEISYEFNEMPNVHLIEFTDVKNVFKKRNRNSHKGTYGKVGFVSGSSRITQILSYINILSIKHPVL